MIAHPETADGRRLDPGLGFRDSGLADLLGFWERSRQGRDLPCRADFTPEDLRGHPRWVILIDVETAPQRFRMERVRYQGIA